MSRSRRPGRPVLRAALTAVLALTVACSGDTGAPPAAGPSSAAPAPGASAPAPGGEAGLGDLTVTQPTVWLCRPGLADNPCETDLDTTLVRPDGSTSVEPFRPAANPPVDCFYVYPTASTAPESVQPLAPDPGITQTARLQAGRFSEVCRVFAPIYRSTTLGGLARADSTPEQRAQAAADVSSAWHDYLANDNSGRPVVLIGHSQGTRRLKQLIADEIDDNPAVRSRIQSALLIGGTVLVPEGKDVGGDFTNVPACRSTTQRGCVVAYNSFLRTPPEDSRFARISPTLGGGDAPPPPGSQVLCVNPAALGGGAATPRPVLATTGADVPTTFESYPDRLSLECAVEGAASYLRVSKLRADDPRPPLPEPLGPTWGLHVLDVNLALGDLVELVRTQSRG